MKTSNKDFNTLDTRITDKDGDADTLPDVFFQKGKRGFPWPADHVKKQPVSIRLDAGLVEYLKGTGKSWQSRASAQPRKMMEDDG